MTSCSVRPDGWGWLALRWWPVTQSAVVTMLIPASRICSYRSTSGKTPWKVTQSGRAARISATVPVAVTPTGASPTISPASRPILSGE